jgi:hypothetical protein
MSDFDKNKNSPSKKKNKKRNIRDNTLYESGDGFSTSIWGPAVWHFLHTISFNYKVNPSEEDKDKYTAFLISLGDVLPCLVCRSHYTENLTLAKFKRKDLKNRHTFSRFIYRLHKIVNKRHHNRELPVKYYKMRDNYEIFRAKCTPGVGCILTPDYIKSKARIEIAPEAKTRHLPSFTIDEKCYEKVKEELKKKKKNSRLLVNS